MQLPIAPRVELELEVAVNPSATAVGRYVVTGPASKLEMIESARAQGAEVIDIVEGQAVEGKLSPLAPCTVPLDKRGVAAIPQDATHFAFAYPVEDLESALQELNLADEKWGFLLLVGGFCYFDAGGAICQCNALTLVPSSHNMTFQGPHLPCAPALQALRQAGRLYEVTLEALQQAGFFSFGWVHPGEMPGGHALTDESNPFGGFVYEMVGDEPPRFFALVPPTEDDMDEYLAVHAQREVSNRKMKASTLERMGSTVGGGMLSSIRRQAKEAKREQRIMDDLTKGEGEDAISKSRRTYMKRTAIILARFFSPLGAAVASVLLLVFVAYVNRGAYETLAVLLFYSCFVFVTWVPLRDTAALAVLSNPYRALLLRVLLMLGPLIMIGLRVIITFAAHLVGSDRSSLDFATEICEVFVVDLGVPLVVYLFRRKAAADMLKGKGRRTKKQREMLGAVATQHFRASGLQANREDGSMITEVQGFGATAQEDAAAPATVPQSAAATNGTSIVHVVPTSSEAAKGRWRAGRVLPTGWGGSNRVTPAAGEPADEAVDTRGPEVVQLSPEDKRRRAAIKLQSRLRMRVATRRYRQELEWRRARLLNFEWPIFCASLLSRLGTVLFVGFAQQEVSYPTLWQILIILPSFVVAFRDLRRETPPRFSIAHCIFLTTVLYRMAFKAAEIDVLVLSLSSDALLRAAPNTPEYADILAPIITMVCHFMLFILVTLLSKLSLSMVATKNACAHLLFPLQFFDFVFLYAFFSLRSVSDGLSVAWVLQQALLQVNIMMRNSGTTDALLRRHLGRCIGWLLGNRKLKRANVNDDPLFRLQFLARITVQFDLADINALVIVPSVVSFFVWRDGWFTLEGSGILVRSCDLTNMWLRFIVLMVIKPAASGLARLLLIRTMRRTLLGKPTMHGVSPLAAKIMTERKMKAAKRSTSEHRRSIDGIDAQLQTKLKLTEEEMAAVQSEFSLTGLNFRILRKRQVRKFRFFCAVAVMQCYAAFPVRRTAPIASDFTELVSMNLTAEDILFTAPTSVWMYVPPAVAFQLDSELRAAFQDLSGSDVCALWSEASAWDFRFGE